MGRKKQIETSRNILTPKNGPIPHACRIGIGKERPIRDLLLSRANGQCGDMFYKWSQQAKEWRATPFGIFFNKISKHVQQIMKIPSEVTPKIRRHKQTKGGRRFLLASAQSFQFLQDLLSLGP